MNKMSAAVVATAIGILAAPHVANAYTVFTGTLTLKVTVSIVSNISTSSAIQCSFSAFAFGTSDTAEESDTVTATRSGSTAVCTLPIPYEWHLYNASQDTVSLSYTVTALDSNANGRSTTNGIGSIGVPANGANLSYSVGARL